MKNDNKVIKISIVVLIVMIIIIGIAIFVLFRTENNTSDNILVNDTKQDNSLQTNNTNQSNLVQTDSTNQNNLSQTNVTTQSNSILNNNIQSSSGEVKILNTNETVKGFSIKENINTTKEYIELTQQTYENYRRKDNQTFRIQEATYNNNGTITVKGRIYKYLDLPTLTAQQYQALADGKSLVILGEKVTKEDDDTIAKKAGYDMKLNIETEEYSYKMIYYAKRNTNGTATLYTGVDSMVAEGTNIYMQITLDKNLNCIESDKKVTLDEHFKGNYHIEDKNRTRLLFENDEFVFKNGTCTSIIFSNL